MNFLFFYTSLRANKWILMIEIGYFKISVITVKVNISGHFSARETIRRPGKKSIGVPLLTDIKFL